MKMTYDKQADVLYIKFSDNKIVESEEKEKNVIVDFDNENNIVGIEILYFVKKYKNDVFPVFKEVEKAVWEMI
ncbi:MAG: DUF2283 domain-containing protein [Bacteroidales bacterium]|nr:DUF2283 domain-containing protein [Bacteroidales bacterium]MCF8456271.1 DUF2283 domain-containing protein [Bacteroidales bacterium]